MLQQIVKDRFVGNRRRQLKTQFSQDLASKLWRKTIFDMCCVKYFRTDSQDNLSFKVLENIGRLNQLSYLRPVAHQHDGRAKTLTLDRKQCRYQRILRSRRDPKFAERRNSFTCRVVPR